MTLLSTHFKALAIGAIATMAMPSAHAGSSEDAMEATLQRYQTAKPNAEWQNTWMPHASAHAVAIVLSGDVQMSEMIASYTRSSLDKGGWKNTLMSNSNYTAMNPLLAVDIGSGATSRLVENHKMPRQLASR